MKVGIFYAYWVNDWDVDFHPLVDRAAEIGFDVLEVNAGTVANMTTDERQSLRSHADDRNIALSYVVGLQKQYDISSADESVRKNGIGFLQKIAEAVGQMGGGPVGGIIYGAWPDTMPDGGGGKRPYFERSVASMKEAIKAAEYNNVTFNIEVVNRFEQFIFNTCKEAVEYVQAVESSNARIMLDTFHMNIEEDFLSTAILEAGELLGHFHIGENNRKPPGHGHIPWVKVASMLRQINYHGYVVMEPFLMPGGEVGRDIKVYGDLDLGVNLDQQASHALQFVRGILK